MTSVLEAPTRGRATTPQRPARPAWMPVATVAAGTCFLTVYYGVSIADLVRFTVFVGLAVVLPGTLWWRWFDRRPRSLVEDVAAGAALGYALEVLAYLLARAAGAPLLALLWPAGTLVAFAVVPRLRRNWRGGPDAPRPPALWSWAMAALFGLVMLYVCAAYFRNTSLTWPGYASADADMPMHLALLGEIKHHLPPQVPYVPDTPLYYHWFVYAEMASTSWSTGIEPLVLLRRLSLLPYLAVTIVLIAAIARRLTGRWWCGPAAVAVSFLVLAPYPYGWRLTSWLSQYGLGIAEDGSLLRLSIWLSPTQTFAAALFAAAVLVLIDLLRGAGRTRSWITFGVLLVVTMGAKATYLPMLLAALVLVVATGLIRRRPSRPALVAALLTAACVAFAQFVLFGGVSQGLHLSPLASMKVIGVGAETGLFNGPAPPLALPEVVGVHVLCWFAIWGGIVGLWRHRRFLAPEVLVLLGIGLAGVAASSLLAQVGYSQSFFFTSARPYLSIAAVCGLATLRVHKGALVAAAALGAATIVVLRRLGPTTLPDSKPSLMLAIGLPYAALAGAALLAVGVPRLLGRRPAVALILVALLGCGAESAVDDRLLPPVRTALASTWRGTFSTPTLISEGTMEAGRWLRDHSSPTDLVATNAHCLFPASAGQCLSMHLSIAAFTERRVLVESWGLTDRSLRTAVNLGTPGAFIPFWDPALLAANDLAFSAPSPATLGSLRALGVRWLFVDRVINPASADLGRYAPRRFSSADCAVYELVP